MSTKKKTARRPSIKVDDTKKSWGLFSRFGIEIEYMICDKDTLEVRPIADLLIKALAGKIQNEVSLGKIAVSNELALHVIELKTDEVLTSLEHAPERFQEIVALLNEKAAEYNAVLLPGGMHPFMDPMRETKLWEHEQNLIYESYNAIFNCKGHGWSNLQSTHLNLPFSTEEEFVQLHRSIRLLMPLFPALSASSPIVEGEKTGMLDTRLFVYRNNQAKIPTIAGKVVPEDIRSFEEYRTNIFEPMWRDIAPFDQHKLLQEEWLNSRGAITRFERDAIEIRVLDTQECPRHDAAILFAIVEMLKNMVERCRLDEALGSAITTEELSSLFFDVAHHGQKTLITLPSYLALFKKTAPCTVQELLKELLGHYIAPSSTHMFKEPLLHILEQGPLSYRLSQSVSNKPDRNELVQIWKKLSSCLLRGETFYVANDSSFL